MASLTIQQRDLLYELLNTSTPVAVTEIAGQMNLTPRQVTYRLKPIKTWLVQHDAVLKATPGVGIIIECSSPQRLSLLHELDAQSNYQLVLTPGQRQQLFALNLLMASEPLILNRLQYVTSISRTTILKDLDPIEAWVQDFGLELIRRPNYGLFLDGSEMARRQALAAILWGDIPFEDPLTAMTYHDGLNSSLSDTGQLPIVQDFSKLLRDLDTQTALEWVTYAEAQQGGRFTDDAVLLLTLAFSIQRYRVQMGQFIDFDTETLQWLESQKVWQVAVDVAKHMWPDCQRNAPASETAGITMHLLAGLRDHVWPGDLEIDPTLTELIDELMDEVVKAFSTPGLRHDTALRDGLIAHIIPAIMRQRFNLWAPPSWSDSAALSRQYNLEYNIAQELALLVTERTGVHLPPGEIDTLTLLLRAAFVRERPYRPKRVLIICPSGMATAQLLVARLKTRFPGLEIMGVLSLRELTPENVAGAHLLISTVPLLRPPKPGLPVIQVHPLLLPEDIETITHWLT